MSVEFAYRIRETPPKSVLADLDVVALTVPVVTDEGDTMPVGTEGTIVGVQNGGAFYVVEFAEPSGALATVEPREIRRVEQAGR